MDHVEFWLDVCCEQDLRHNDRCAEMVTPKRSVRSFKHSRNGKETQHHGTPLVPIGLQTLQHNGVERGWCIGYFIRNVELTRGIVKQLRAAGRSWWRPGQGWISLQVSHGDTALWMPSTWLHAINVVNKRMRHQECVQTFCSPVATARPPPLKQSYAGKRRTVQSEWSLSRALCVRPARRRNS